MVRMQAESARFITYSSVDLVAQFFAGEGRRGSGEGRFAGEWPGDL